MKAFIPNDNTTSFIFNNDMEKILSYLNSHGELRISAKAVQSYYSEYCENFYCAGWLEPESDILASFANWLSKQDI